MYEKNAQRLCSEESKDDGGLKLEIVLFMQI